MLKNTKCTKTEVHTFYNQTIFSSILYIHGSVLMFSKFSWTECKTWTHSHPYPCNMLNDALCPTFYTCLSILITWNEFAINIITSHCCWAHKAATACVNKKSIAFLCIVGSCEDQQCCYNQKNEIVWLLHLQESNWMKRMGAWQLCESCYKSVELFC